MKIAALFPGQGSHMLGMGQMMADAFPVAQAVMHEAEAGVPGLLHQMTTGPMEELTLTVNQQPALVAASVAAYRAWQAETGLTPAFAAGHSLGEYSAHVAAGTLTMGDALRLTRRRGQLMQDAVPAGTGAMSAVMGDPGVVAEILAQQQGAEIANLNAPAQTVISGERAAVEAAGAALRARGLKVIALKVSAPFHCSLMEPARAGLSAELHAATYAQMLFPVIANVTAQPVRDAAQVAALLEAQITGTVRWVETVQRLAELGADTFIEFGAGTVLTGLVRRILPEANTFNVHTPDDLTAFSGWAESQLD